MSSLNINLTSNVILDWTAYPIYMPVSEIVTRASARAFVGLPLCMSLINIPLLLLLLVTDEQYPGRNPEYLHIAEHWTEAVVIKGQIINFLPDFLKPYVHIFTSWALHGLSTNGCDIRIANVLIRSTQNHLKQAMKLLGPTIEYRLSQFNEFGKEWPEKPVRSSSRYYRELK